MVFISALQHIVYCPRQTALIHLEQVWVENRFTAEGQVLHARVDEPKHEKRRGVKTISAMPLRCLTLGITGVADLVEIHGNLPLPVEYKRGKPKSHKADEIQLCAQALCLEEMFQCIITEGALYYGEPKRRIAIVFDDTLRTLTLQAINAMHALFAHGTTPPPVYERRKCDACSLIEICKPKTIQHDKSKEWLMRAINEEAP